MKRAINYHLEQWKGREVRKPLVLRGARQVGKTHAVRTLGKSFENYVEINLEQNRVAREVFEQDLSPDRIIRDLSLLAKQPIVPGKTLLFLDEVQEQPKALLALRYFYEEMPELHVVAAGSLLDFAIERIGIPVGRVEYLFMRPLSFIEFMCAAGQKQVAQLILTHSPEQPLTEAIHEQLMRSFWEYLAVGGMPEVVQSWVDQQDLRMVAQQQQNIVFGYIQDIPKYATKNQMTYVDVVFHQVPYLLGQRFKTSHIVGEYRKRDIAPALDLLEKAMLIRRIYHTSAQGLPLAGQCDLDKFKLMFIDVALVQRLLNVDHAEWILNPKMAAVNKGAIIESFVGQELLAYQDPTLQGELFYWHREERSASAEVDYVVALRQDVVPIEVKSDKGSHLKSMRSFLQSHSKSTYGIRFSGHNYSVVDSVRSYPLYAVAALFKDQHQSLQALVQ